MRCTVCVWRGEEEEEKNTKTNIGSYNVKLCCTSLFHLCEIFLWLQLTHSQQMPRTSTAEDTKFRSTFTRTHEYLSDLSSANCLHWCGQQNTTFKYKPIRETTNTRNIYYSSTKSVDAFWNTSQFNHRKKRCTVTMSPKNNVYTTKCFFPNI